MAAELLVLRLVHVLGGIAWVGFAAFNTIFLIPSLGEAGPAAGPVMAGLQKRRLFTALPVIAVLTILSGLRLLAITSTGFSGAWFATRSGLGYATGAVAGLLGFTLAMAFTRPSMARVAVLMATRANATAERQRELDAEVGRLRARAGWSGQWSTVLLVVSAALMGVSRYL